MSDRPETFDRATAAWVLSKVSNWALDMEESLGDPETHTDTMAAEAEAFSEVFIFCTFERLLLLEATMQEGGRA